MGAITKSCAFLTGHESISHVQLTDLSKVDQSALLIPAPDRGYFARQELNKAMPWATTARDPSQRLSYISCVGSYASVKMGRRYPFEALPEMEAMLILDTDPDVKAFCSQPETISWIVGKRRHKYTPDLLIEMTNGKLEYREVKTERRRRADPNMKGRREHIEEECRLRGASFSFWTREEIRGGYRLRNAKYLRSCLSFLNDESISTVRKALSLAGLPTTLGALERVLNGNKELLRVVLGLIIIGELTTDLDVEIGPRSLISYGNHPRHPS